MSLSASIVVPTCHRPDLLDRCLAALLDQRIEPSRFEIVVVDDAASAATRRQVERWRDTAQERGMCLRYVPTAGRCGPAAARNAGWRAARGEIVAFTDDDCIPEPAWLAAGLAAFTGPIAAVDGRVVMPLPVAPTDYEKNAAGLEAAEFVTANCFYRWSVLAEIGGFDERFRLAWREDSDLYFRVLERGLPVARADDAVVLHPIRPAGWGISLSQQRKSAYNALLYRNHPKLYRERIQSSPPWHYYRILAALLTALGAALRGKRRAALLALLAWLVLTSRFCASRLAVTSHRPAHISEMIVTSALIPPLAIYWRLRGAFRFRVVFL